MIEFINIDIEERKASLFETSISELCFSVDDIDLFYQHLIDQGVEVFSQPQHFDSMLMGLEGPEPFTSGTRMAMS